MKIYHLATLSRLHVGKKSRSSLRFRGLCTIRGNLIRQRRMGWKNGCGSEIKSSHVFGASGRVAKWKVTPGKVAKWKGLFSKKPSVIGDRVFYSETKSSYVLLRSFGHWGKRALLKVDILFKGRHFGRKTFWLVDNFDGSTFRKVEVDNMTLSKSRHFDGQQFGILQLGSRNPNVAPFILFKLLLSLVKP
jgi:hypothetical protein